MELTGYLGMKSKPELLWREVFSTEAWKRAIPDAESYEKIEDNTYEMVVKIDMPIFKGAQTVTIVFNDQMPPRSTNFTIETGMIKSANGSFEIAHHSDFQVVDEPVDFQDGTVSVMSYKLQVDAGNPLVNAALEGFKPKIKNGLEEILLRLDPPA